MTILTGRERDMPPGLSKQLGRYRHRVFVEKLGWELNTSEGIERDQFDRDDAIYVSSMNQDGEINGCARLLPTTRPYLLGEVFPQLLHGGSPPSQPEVWELSRFAAMDFDSPCQTTPMAQFSSPLAVDLLEAALECAASHGAHKVIIVSPLGVERLLRKAGFHAQRVAPPVNVNGSPILACWIRCRAPAPAAPTWRHGHAVPGYPKPLAQPA